MSNIGCKVQQIGPNCIAKGARVIKHFGKQGSRQDRKKEARVAESLGVQLFLEEKHDYYNLDFDDFEDDDFGYEEFCVPAFRPAKNYWEEEISKLYPDTSDLVKEHFSPINDSPNYFDIWDYDDWE